MSRPRRARVRCAQDGAAAGVSHELRRRRRPHQGGREPCAATRCNWESPCRSCSGGRQHRDGSPRQARLRPAGRLAPPGRYGIDFGARLVRGRRSAARKLPPPLPRRGAGVRIEVEVTARLPLCAATLPRSSACCQPDRNAAKFSRPASPSCYACAGRAARRGSPCSITARASRLDQRERVFGCSIAARRRPGWHGLGLASHASPSRPTRLAHDRRVPWGGTAHVPP
jgi:hypothetical protein